MTTTPDPMAELMARANARTRAARPSPTVIVDDRDDQARRFDDQLRARVAGRRYTEGQGFS